MQVEGVGGLRWGVGKGVILISPPRPQGVRMLQGLGGERHNPPPLGAAT